MKLSEFMANYTANPEYKGLVTNDNMVLAIDITKEALTEGDYEVVGTSIMGVDRQLNPTTSTNNYLYTGSVTSKNGQEPTFKITGHRYEGDPAQDYMCSNDIKFGVGEAVKVPYVWLSTLTFKGEKSVGAIIVNSDGGGNASENSAIDIDLRVTQKPVEYTYSAA